MNVLLCLFTDYFLSVSLRKWWKAFFLAADIEEEYATEYAK